MVATRSKSSSSNNNGRRGGKKDKETVASKAAVTGEKKLFTSCVRSEGTLAMFEKFYSSGIKAEKAENGALRLVGPTYSTGERSFFCRRRVLAEFVFADRNDSADGNCGIVQPRASREEKRPQSLQRKNGHSERAHD
jgi:hypothetical protein